MGMSVTYFAVVVENSVVHSSSSVSNTHTYLMHYNDEEILNFSFLLQSSRV